MDYSKEEMLKSGTQEQFDINEIREKFISKYCMSRGWDLRNLNPEQLNEIKNQKEYKNPGIILG
jgi:hypothetical protein